MAKPASYPSPEGAKRPSDALAPRIIVALALFCFATRWARVALDAWPVAWHWDFKYFWLAANMWTSGASPYGGAYLHDGRVLFPEFAAPFFYPPNILPFIAPLGLLEPNQSAWVLFGLNIALIISGAACCAKIARKLNSRFPEHYIFAGILLITSFYIRPFFSVVVYGQVTLVLMAASALFIWALLKKQNAFLAIALCLLLIKPQFGVAMTAFALCRAETRNAALAAIIATLFLAAIGLGLTHPLNSAEQFLSNLSAYSDFTDNAPMRTGGLSFLFGGFPFAVSPFFTLIAAAGPPALMGWASQRQVSPAFAAGGAIVWSLLASPHHAADFVILAPVLAFAIAPISRVWRATIALCFLFLGQSWDIARMITPALLDHAPFAAAGHTITLAVLCALLCALALRPMSTAVRPQPIG